MTTLQYATEEECRSAFDRMKARAPALVKTTAAERLAKMRRLHQAMYDMREEIGRVGKEALGQDGRAQLVPIPHIIRDMTKNLEKWMQPVEIEQSPAMMGVRGYVRYQPKGVVLHLPSWNAPFLIALSPVLSMIAAGNAVVLKPSEVAPETAELIGRIVEKSGLGEDIAVVQGGAETASALLKLPFNHICYVGNNRVGRLIMKAAAEHFADITLEMGGKNAMVVAADADLDDTAAKIVFSRLIIAGQACLCGDYILAHDSIRKELTAKIVEKITAFYNPEGKGVKASGDLGRIVNERHTLRIKGLIDDAVSKGATLVTGGEIDVAERFISPTLLDNVTEAMEIFQEEVFGPVLTIHGWSTREEAVAEVEKRPTPLGFYVFTQSRELADWFIDHTHAGSSAVNGVALQATVPELPFGGLNHSGIGQLNGEAAFRSFSNARGVVEDALDPAQRVPANYPPFPAGMEAFLDVMIAPLPESTGATLTADSPIEAIMAVPAGEALLRREMPELPDHPAFSMFKSMSLKSMQGLSGGMLTDELIAKVDEGLKSI